MATIKPAPPRSDGRTHTRISSDTDTGNLAYSNVNLKELIGKAFKLQQYQISGPDWLETERFDVVAKFPPHSEAEQVPLMLQALLAERFRLSFHRQTRTMPVYSLMVAKNGAKFKAVETGTGITSNSNRTERHVVARVSMNGFCEFLTGEAGRPVLDTTGLAGFYEMKIDWAPDSASAGNDAASLPSLFTALQEQLGLKLEATRGPVEVLAVDHIERTPTDN